MLHLANIPTLAWMSFPLSFGFVSDSARGGGPDMAVVVVVLLAGWAAGMVAALIVRTLVRVLPLEKPASRTHGEPSSPVHEIARLAGFATFWLVMFAAALFALDRLGVEKHFILFAAMVLLTMAGFAIFSAWRLGLMDTVQLLLAGYLQALDDERRDKSS